MSLHKAIHKSFHLATFKHIELAIQEENNRIVIDKGKIIPEGPKEHFVFDARDSSDIFVRGRIKFNDLNIENIFHLREQIPALDQMLIDVLAILLCCLPAYNQHRYQINAPEYHLFSMTYRAF